VVLKALTKDAAQRYQTATEFLRELEMLLSDSAMLEGPIAAAASAARSSRGAHRGAEACAAACLLPAAALGDFNPHPPDAFRLNAADVLVLGATIILLAAAIVLVRL
jgi:hypothetical protein